MTNHPLPEVWLRGALPEIPPLLQPAAFALLQTGEELHEILNNFPEELLYQKLGERASVAFHLKHITGVLDRMLTYAKAEMLNETQFEYLKHESSLLGFENTETLISAFDIKVVEALDYFKSLKDADFTAYRSVGRKELPSTLIGVLFHSAEHAQRHLGQLLVTASWLKNRQN